MGTSGRRTLGQGRSETLSLANIRSSATWKKTFGYHPLFCFLDDTREALSGLLRGGGAGSNTTADHVTVLDLALAQIPDAYRHGTDILIRSDSAGCTHGFLARKG